MRTAPLLTIDLLRLLAPTDDIRQFRCNVLHIWGSYQESIIDRRLRELHEGGLISDHGLPHTGWLTKKGKAVLARRRDA